MGVRVKGMMVSAFLRAYNFFRKLMDYFFDGRFFFSRVIRLTGGPLITKDNVLIGVGQMNLLDRCDTTQPGISPYF